MRTTAAERATGGRRRSRPAVAALAALLALGLPASAAAGAGGVSPGELRDLLRARLDAHGGARAAAAGAIAARVAARPANRRAGLRALAARRRPARVIVGLRSPGEVAAMARLLRGHGARVSPLPGLAAVAVSARSPARLAAALARRPEVAYAEPAARRALLSHADVQDVETRIPFAWAFGTGPGHLGVNAGPALAAVGGGSGYPVAVVDSGIDPHPALRRNVTRRYDAVGGRPDAGDSFGHGTFIAGLIGAEGGQQGLHGVAGRTDVYAVRVGGAGGTDPDLSARGIVWAADNGARILNLSFGGTQASETERRALDYAFYRDVLPVAAAGNTAERGNDVTYPAAFVGGTRGATGIGLAVGATRPTGAVAEFSTRGHYVSVAAPGASPRASDRAHGVYSTLSSAASMWDGCLPPRACYRVFGAPGTTDRYAYAEGTSFAAPLAAGAASVAWMANRELTSEQVADVIVRSARRTVAGAPGCDGPGWNACTGHGLVDAGAAVAVAARYDTTEPRPAVRVRRRGRSRLAVRVSGTDRTAPGHELAGGVTATLYTSRDKRSFRRYAGPRAGSLTRALKLSRRRRLYLEALVCDANVNCAVVRRGPFRARRR